MNICLKSLPWKILPTKKVLLQSEKQASLQLSFINGLLLVLLLLILQQCLLLAAQICFQAATVSS